MLPEFSIPSHNSPDSRVIEVVRRLDAANQKPEAGTPRITPECKDMYSLRQPQIFSFVRYLFPWFGFNASEFTCANLGIKGDALHDLFSPEEVMSVRNAIALLLALFVLVLLVGCGSSSPKAVAPPSGGFSNSSLNGTYVFSASGTDLINGTFFAVAGTVVANGSGGLTGGSFDFIDPATGVSTGNSVSGGTYRITTDGRGSATLPGNTLTGNLGVDFVLTSSTHGLITRFDIGGTASGTIDLQGTQTAPSGSYSFSMAGADGSDNPFNSVGSFTLSGPSITSGFQDFNDHYTISSETGLTNLPLSGTVVAGPGVGPEGTQLSTSSTFGTLSFDVFEIDSTHLKFIETDGLDFLTGDAFTQQASIPAGQLVFTMAGFDVSEVFFAAGGYITTDGVTITTGLEDINDGGTLAQATPSLGAFVPTGGGRFTLSLNGIFNGSSNPGLYTFAAYPTVNGGIQLLEIDGAGITSGTAYLQTSTSLATPQGYALNLTGADLNAGIEVDEIAEFTAQSGGLTGIDDINDGGSLLFDKSLGNSTYTLDTPATGRGEISTAQFGLFFYVIDSSSVIFIETDSSPVGLGTFQVQTAPTPGAAQPGVAAFRPLVRPHAAWRRKQ